MSEARELGLIGSGNALDATIAFHYDHTTAVILYVCKSR